jgi:uncharacterized protein with PIN domain
MERRFLADAMLGSLAKWLRVLGCDAHYRSHYREGSLGVLLEEGRLLLSRNRKTVRLHAGSVLIRSDRVGEQLREMRSAGLTHSRQERWFTRCLRCNAPLEKVPPPESMREIPEYVFFERPDEISRCPSCGRYYWPGTHRERMMVQLREWGL